MLHLMKLAVGVRDLEHLRALQAERCRTAPPLRHLTRHCPRRAEELLDGGSLYWVIAGSMLARQRLLNITRVTGADGAARAALELDPVLVPLRGRPTAPFQGWRYLRAEAAPPDLPPDAARAGEALPPALARELRGLGLL